MYNIEIIKNMKKRNYIKPILNSEAFVPCEYIAACYDFTAIFKCYKGQNNLDWHGAPCATTYVEIKGVNSTGHESGSKVSVKIFDIDYNGFNLSGNNVGVGTTIPNLEWKSTDTVDGTGTYQHYGTGEITSQVLQDPTRPNHP